MCLTIGVFSTESIKLLVFQIGKEETNQKKNAKHDKTSQLLSSFFVVLFGFFISY